MGAHPAPVAKAEEEARIQAEKEAAERAKQEAKEKAAAENEAERPHRVAQ